MINFLKGFFKVKSTFQSTKEQPDKSFIPQCKTLLWKDAFFQPLGMLRGV